MKRPPSRSSRGPHSPRSEPVLTDRVSGSGCSPREGGEVAGPSSQPERCFLVGLLVGLRTGWRGPVPRNVEVLRDGPEGVDPAVAEALVAATHAEVNSRAIQDLLDRVR